MRERSQAVRSEVRSADFFEKLGYATVWEDDRVIDEALRPRPGERAFSITSGGDFSLQLALCGAEVVSLDFNPRQSFLLELKREAARRLDHDELWELMGIASSQRRTQLYERVRGALGTDARDYWDATRKAVEGGLLSSGKQDQNLHINARVIGRLQGRKTVERYFEITDPAELEEFFDRHWNGLRWRLFCRLMFSRFVYDRMYHPDHFRYADPNNRPNDVMRRQLEHVFCSIPGRANYYWYWAFNRTYPDRECCPAWLRRSNAASLPASMDRLSIENGALEEFLVRQPDSSFDCFNFSNIFDWVSPEAFTALMQQVVRVARPGARLCYWTNIVNTRRVLSETGLPQIIEDEELGRRLANGARATGYGSCTVGRVEK